MKILGAAYMSYLMIKTVIPPKKNEPDKSKSHNASFFIGVGLQFVNPKGILFAITVMSSYILPYYTRIPTLILFSLMLSFIGFTGLLCWALFGSLFSILFSKHGKLLNITMALLLLYCIVSLFI